jgi:hypothetical protein
MPSTGSIAAAVTLTAMLAFGPSVIVAGDSPRGKPSILLIVVDDLGYSDLGRAASVAKENKP